MNDRSAVTAANAADHDQYHLPWSKDEDEFPDDQTMWHGWTAQDWSLAGELHVESNHQATEVVEAALAASGGELAARVEFDSEWSCFYAYTETEADMVALAEVIDGLVAAVDPNAPVISAPPVLLTPELQREIMAMFGRPGR